MGKFVSGRKTKQSIWAFSIGIAASAVALLISNTSLLKVWELKTYDLRMALVQRSRPKPQNVVMFYVDEGALRQMEAQGINWPWPRELYAGALDFCRRGGARAVFFDLFFSEDSVYGLEDDEQFAAGLKKGPPSYLALFLSKNEGKADSRWAVATQKSRVPFEGNPPEWASHEKSFMSLPVEALLNAAFGLGNVQMPPDEDGVYRRVSLLDGLDQTAIPSIVLKIASDIKNIQDMTWVRPTEFHFGDTKIPLDRNGRLLVNYYGGADTFPAYSLANILVANAAIASGQTAPIDLQIVKDKVVIVGVAAPGLYDLKPTPLSRIYPAPEIHATAIENLLTNNFLSELKPLAAVGISMAAGIAAALGLAMISSSWGLSVFFISALASIFGASVFLFWRGIWMPVVAPLGAFSASSFAMIMHNYLTEGRKKRDIRRAFGQYLSPHVVAEISRNPEGLVLGGKEQEVTLFFSDIVGFTSISEKTPPPELVGQLNKYFLELTKIIQGTEGTLDKYIGDAIMAFWGAPLSLADHAKRAVAAAIEIQNVLNKQSLFATRIGIHTGPAVVGNIGSDIRFNYTAIGDTVNLASRLEGLNKKFGTRIIISGATREKLGTDFETRLIGKVRVKGRDEPLSVYEPLGLKGDFGYLTPKFCEAFGIAIDLYREAKFEEAGSIFKGVFERSGDPVSSYYSEACERNMREKPENFDGVTTFTTK